MHRFAYEVCGAHVPFAAELFFSLLSVIVTYDPIGWGVPYAGSFSSDMPLRQVDMSAQVRYVVVLSVHIYFFLSISLIADGPQRCHPPCGH